MGFLYSQLFITPKYPTGSFAGQTVIVTGSNIGLGFEAARHIVRLGAAKVILAVRNTTAGENAKQLIEESTGAAGICQVWELDLASYRSVQAFASRVMQLSRLDVLIENAGIATTRYKAVGDHESTITINVISTFLLAFLILPKMKETAKKFPSEMPRLSIVTSEVHAWTNLPEWRTENTFETLDHEETADMKSRYAASKLLQIFLARELASKIGDCGVILNMLQPGMCHSQLTREDDNWFNSIFKLILARSTEVGSRTLVAAALAGPESHGLYMRDGIVDNGALSDFVTSEDGKKAQQKVWKETMEILRRIRPDMM